MGIAADVGVEGGDSVGGVEDEEADVGGLEVLAGHDDGQLFGHEAGLALATDSGGVDETEVVRAASDDLVYGVAGGAGDGRDNGARAAGEGVEKRGFADVGAADDGDLGLVLDECAVGAETAGRVGWKLCVVSCKWKSGAGASSLLGATKTEVRGKIPPIGEVRRWMGHPELR